MRIEKHAVLAGHTGSVYALLPFGESGLFSAGSDRLVAEWDLQNPEEGNILVKTSDIVYSLLQLPSGKLLVGQAAGGIHVIDLASRKEERLLQYHRSAVFNMVHIPRLQIVLSLSGDGELGVLDDAELKLQKVFTLGGGKLRGISVNQEANLLALGSGDGVIRVFSLPGMEEVANWQAHLPGYSANAVTFSPDGRWLLSGSRDAMLKVYDVAKGFELVHDIPAHNYAIYSIEYHADGLVFATGSRDKTIKIWDASTFEVLQRIDKERSMGHVNSVNKIVWHPASKQLISASDDRAVMVWNSITDYS